MNKETGQNGITQELSTSAPQQKEVVSNPLEIVDLVKLSRKGLAEFKKKVERCSGRLPVLVHPFTDDTRPGYRKLLDQYVTACLEKQVPLVVFEEKRFAKALPQQLRVSVPSTLYRGITTDGFFDVGYRRGIEWEDYEHILNSVGVRHIMLGGQSADLEVVTGGSNRTTVTDLLEEYGVTSNTQPNATKMLSAGITPFSCVGRAARLMLRSGFDVTILSVSSPNYLVGGNIIAEG